MRTRMNGMKKMLAHSMAAILLLLLGLFVTLNAGTVIGVGFGLIAAAGAIGMGKQGAVKTANAFGRKGKNA